MVLINSRIPNRLELEPVTHNRQRRSDHMSLELAQGVESIDEVLNIVQPPLQGRSSERVHRCG